MQNAALVHGCKTSCDCMPEEMHECILPSQEALSVAVMASLHTSPRMEEDYCMDSVQYVCAAVQSCLVGQARQCMVPLQRVYTSCSRMERESRKLSLQPSKICTTLIRLRLIYRPTSTCTPETWRCVQWWPYCNQDTYSRLSPF